MPTADLIAGLTPLVDDAAVGASEQAIIDRAARWAWTYVAPRAETWERASIWAVAAVTGTSSDAPHPADLGVHAHILCKIHQKM